LSRGVAPWGRGLVREVLAAWGCIREGAVKRDVWLCVGCVWKTRCGDVFGCAAHWGGCGR